MQSLFSCFVAFCATILSIFLLKPLAIRIDLVDHPGGRKIHESPVPLIGGIAIFIGFCFAMLTLSIDLHSYRGLFAGSGLLVFMGVIDDFHELGSKLKLLGQFLAAIFLVIWGHNLLINLGDLFFLGKVSLGVWGIPLTIFIVVGYINSMNMIDGQDGLVGGIGLAQILLLSWLAWQTSQIGDLHILLVSAVLLVTFLAFNMRSPWRKKATIFIGDSGSTFIAFIIAWFGIKFAHAPSDLFSPLTVLWIVAFPIFDLVSVIISRIQEGKSPLAAGRDHIHHYLHGLGMDVRVSTMLLISLSLGLGCLGLLLNHLEMSESWQFVLFSIILVVYLIMVRLLTTNLKFRVHSL